MSYKIACVPSENANKHAQSGSVSAGHSPSRQMTFIQRRLNVDATSGRCIDVEATLYKRHVPAGQWLAKYQECLQADSEDSDLSVQADLSLR